MPLKIKLKKHLIIGTSNSIVNGGWFDGFKDNSKTEVDRVALGGAPFTQFFSKISDINFTDYSLVILECTPNDETYADKIGFAWYFDTLYQNFLAMIVQYTKLVILRVPTLQFIESPSAVWERQQTIASNLNVRTYDITELLVNNNKSDLTSLYRDRDHPLTTNMYNVGKCFSEWLEASILELPSPIEIKPAFRVYKESVMSKSTSSLVNSLINEKFSILSVGQSHKFSQPGVCIGFYIDAGNSWACLRLHGLDDEVRHSFIFFNPDVNKGHMKFVPIKNSFYLKAISITLPYKAVDYALHANVPLHGENRIAFGDFVFLDSN
jgi:hypothetical protein